MFEGFATFELWKLKGVVMMGRARAAHWQASCELDEKLDRFRNFDSPAAFKSEAMWTLADFSADGDMYCKEFAEVMTRILVEVYTTDCLVDFIAFHVFAYEI